MLLKVHVFGPLKLILWNTSLTLPCLPFENDGGSYITRKVVCKQPSFKDLRRRPENRMRRKFKVRHPTRDQIRGTSVVMNNIAEISFKSGRNAGISSGGSYWNIRDSAKLERCFYHIVWVLGLIRRLLRFLGNQLLMS